MTRGSGRERYIIAKDGSGDFTSIQAAIDALPAEGTAPAVLLVRPGVYRERVTVHRDGVRIVGEDRERTVVSYSACARDKGPDGKEKGTFLSFTVLVTGKDVEMENLTVRNDAGDGRDVGQAVALYAAGDRGIYRRVTLIAHQDTLFCGPVMPKVLREAGIGETGAECVDSVGDCPPTCSREYFEDCFIRGDVDFIFGPYRCWFERCRLHMNARGGFYTAANTPEAQAWGFVFHQCALTGDCPAGEAWLGRPWRRFARTLFLGCDMDACVAPRGFSDWDDARRVTERCGEYASRGPGADMKSRHPCQKRLTPGEAGEITLQAVMAGEDGWQPAREGGARR